MRPSKINLLWLTSFMEGSHATWSKNDITCGGDISYENAINDIHLPSNVPWFLSFYIPQEVASSTNPPMIYPQLRRPRDHPSMRPYNMHGWTWEIENSFKRIQNEITQRDPRFLPKKKANMAWLFSCALFFFPKLCGIHFLHYWQFNSTYGKELSCMML